MNENCILVNINFNVKFSYKHDPDLDFPLLPGTCDRNLKHSSTLNVLYEYEHWFSKNPQNLSNCLITITWYFKLCEKWGIIKTAEYHRFDRKNGFPTPKNHTADTHMLWVCSTGAKVINLQDEMSKILNKQECIIFQLCRFLNKHCLDQ